MSGFFDELERQLIEIARAEPQAHESEASGARRHRRALPVLPSLRPLPMAVVAVLVAAIAIAALPGARRSPSQGIAQSPAPRLSRGGKARAKGRQQAVPSWVRSSLAPLLHSLKEASNSQASAAAGMSGLISQRLREGGAAGGHVSDIAWEGSSCSGCYLMPEGSVGNEASAAGDRWAIGVHVGGGNLKRICVWVLSPKGKPEEGSTCSTEAMLAIGGRSRRPGTTVLTQGFTRGGREMKLAGGT